MMVMIVGNDELGLPLGPTTKCPNCGESHDVQVSRGSRTGSLEWVVCPAADDSAYVVGINGKALQKGGSR